jgi:hypothetical protein
MKVIELLNNKQMLIMLNQMSKMAKEQSDQNYESKK